MGLQSMEAGELLSRWRVYPAAEVNDLLARIRAAVAAERASMRETNGAVLPGAALDALLADGGE